MITPLHTPTPPSTRRLTLLLVLYQIDNLVWHPQVLDLQPNVNQRIPASLVQRG